MNIENELALRAEQIDRVVERFLPKEEGFQRTILEAMNYSVRSGGKRLRPMLMQETYWMFGGSGEVVEPFMAAIELIHTYSLVHDDLPAMDNDEYRRNKKTTHAVYGETMGILAGDALLNYAYETALHALAYHAGAPVERALVILARKAGVFGMVGGQAVDVEAEKKGLAVTEEMLAFIHQYKTGALIEASMMVGAALAGASEEQIRAVESVAAKVGLAFQIQDDILDVTGTQEELGKPIGSDERNEKVTFVTFAGMEKAVREVERLSGEAVKELDALGSVDEFLKELFVYLIHRRK